MSRLACQICGINTNLSWCSRCHLVAYCGKDHQKQDWKTHKNACKAARDPVAVDGVRKLNLNSDSQQRNTTARTTNNVNQSDRLKTTKMPQWAAANSVSLEAYMENDVTEGDRQRVNDIWQSMETHGLCMLDKFLPEEHANVISDRVKSIYDIPDYFEDGQILRNKSGPDKVRFDRIHWVDESYSDCPAIKILCKRLDKIVHLFSLQTKYIVESRTRPMIACYPGDGSCYKRHVDNPKRDGRVFTCLYYLNREWNKSYGGNLCLYPKDSRGVTKKVMCEPVFNRMIIFYSDERNPHEVLPTYQKRFAITCWYFDRDERVQAIAQFAQQRQ
ncbi:prolyl hydroxylase EGLN3-like [Clavelina lepadiformis]|uniref:hypoxia-inducible factor-proline dioxygenase n=1 Tax=Clavelina lepadiformis TaxID=159417 RepID=A0ABP0EWS1_CLALP